MLRAFVNENVFFLGITDGVVVDLLVKILGHHFFASFGSGEATVIESPAVLGPGGTRELGPLQVVGEAPSGGNIADMPFDPV